MRVCYWIVAVSALIVLCCQDTKAASTCKGLPLITRRGWNAKRPSEGYTRIPNHIPQVVIHHTETPACTTTSKCKALVRNIQHYHMTDPSRRYKDIGYSFLVGEDGHVYEGRGWNVEGAHTLGYNTKAYGIAFIGNFMNRYPNAAAVSAAKKLIACGVKLGKIRANYCLLGHRDAKGNSTSCPGNKLYALIRKWPHYIGKGQCPK